MQNLFRNTFAIPNPLELRFFQTTIALSPSIFETESEQRAACIEAPEREATESSGRRTFRRRKKSVGGWWSLASSSCGAVRVPLRKNSRSSLRRYESDSSGKEATSAIRNLREAMPESRRPTVWVIGSLKNYFDTYLAIAKFSSLSLP